MMIASGLGLSALDEQVIGVTFVLLYLYYRIVSDWWYLVANMSVCGPIPNNSTAPRAAELVENAFLLTKN